jgi:hypothetical protein
MYMYEDGNPKVKKLEERIRLTSRWLGSLKELKTRYPEDNVRGNDSLILKLEHNIKMCKKKLERIKSTIVNNRGVLCQKI